MEHQTDAKHVRRYNSYTDAFNTTQIQLRNPWVVAWWSAAFPGFGHLSLGMNLKGVLLVVWEIVINNNAGINRAMVDSFCGKFEAAKDAMDTRWLLLYIPVYIYCIWDSYRKTIELNKLCLLAGSEEAPITIFKMNGLTMNSISKRSPRLALAWSLLFPGLGHLFLHRLPIGSLIVGCCFTIAYFAHLADAGLFTIVGSIEQANALLEPGWYSYYPSMFCFAAYDSYRIAVGQNHLFEQELFHYLRQNAQPRDFKLLGSNESEGA